MSADDVERTFREEHGRAVAVLVRAFGDLDVAEEAVQDAFAEAVRRWPVDGPPPSPAGWIITTARNRAIDRLRREGARAGKHAQAALLSGPPPDEGSAVRDDRLRLIFTCCHPVLGTAARVALTLRMVGGLSTAEVARAFLVAEPTMAQRLVRAKARIREERVPYRVPDAADLPARLAGVLAVVYLGPYQIQAAINAVHSRPPADWRQVLALYDQLMAVAPSPVVALNRAVAVAEVEGVDAALPLVEKLDLDRYYLFHAVRADLLLRSGRDGEAAVAYDEALARTEDGVEIAFLKRRRLGMRA